MARSAEKPKVYQIARPESTEQDFIELFHGTAEDIHDLNVADGIMIGDKPFGASRWMVSLYSGPIFIVSLAEGLDPTDLQANITYIARVAFAASVTLHHSVTLAMPIPELPAQPSSRP